MAGPLGTTDGVARLLGVEFDPPEKPQVLALLGRATDVVAAYCGRVFDPADAPGEVVRVVEGMAARCVETGGFSDPTSPAGLVPGLSNISESSGPYSHSFGFSGGYQGSTSPWLSKTDRLVLKRWRGGAFTIGQ